MSMGKLLPFYLFNILLVRKGSLFSLVKAVTVKTFCWEMSSCVIWSSVWCMNVLLTWTAQWAAITPSTGLSEKGSNVLSGRLMKSGFNRYLHLKAFTNHSVRLDCMLIYEIVVVTIVIAPTCKPKFEYSKIDKFMRHMHSIKLSK